MRLRRDSNNGSDKGSQPTLGSKRIADTVRRCIQCGRSMRGFVSLVLVIIRLWFAFSPSYLHPDENFQGPEVIAGKHGYLFYIPFLALSLVLGLHVLAPPFAVDRFS